VQLASIVEEYYGLKAGELALDTRERHVCEARYMFWFFGRAMGTPLSTLARHTKRHPSTVVAGLKEVEGIHHFDGFSSAERVWKKNALDSLLKGRGLL
jgi:hypothetical protein